MKNGHGSITWPAAFQVQTRFSVVYTHQAEFHRFRNLVRRACFVNIRTRRSRVDCFKRQRSAVAPRSSLYKELLTGKEPFSIRG